MYVSTAMFITTAVVEYAPLMLFSNFLVPTCIVQIANINRAEIVSSVLVMPLKVLVNITKIMNKNPAFVGRKKVQFVRFVIHLLSVVTMFFFSALFGIKYPGNHNMVKPNGILHMIFHSGIFNVHARRKHAHKLIIITPNTYSEISTKHTAIKNPITRPDCFCVMPINHI